MASGKCGSAQLSGFVMSPAPIRPFPTPPARGLLGIETAGGRDARLGHRRRRADADRQIVRRVEGPHGHGSGWHRHRRGTGQGRDHRRPGRLRDHGSRHPGGRRADHRPAGRGQRRHPHERARPDRQQGLPVRAERDRHGRSADRLRRVRHRRRGWHGVHDQRALPAAESPLRLPLRRLHPHRRHRLRRPVLHVRPPRNGRLHRRLQRGQAPHPRRAGRVRRDEPRAGHRGSARRDCSTTRWPRCPCRSAKATRCW